MAENNSPPSLTSRPVRSFVIRNGRITAAQKHAIETLMPVFGIVYKPELLDFDLVFGNTAPVWLEIGFGNGDALLHMAQLYPQTNFVGIEVHAPGVGHLLAAIRERGMQNIRVLRHDAVEVLQYMLSPASLTRVLLFFPDPWHKKRHHKRRILQRETVELIERVLVPGGVLHCATDWQEYADAMLEKLQAAEWLINESADGFSDRPSYRPATRFEQRGLRLGHRVRELLFRRL